jgi:hypothetical protein
MPSKWNATGTYFEACNCNVGCPCVFTSDPTEGHCTVLLAWHVETGRHGDLSLDGMNVALAAYTPGNMLKTKWDVALYIDEKANPAQRDALTKIFAGQVGGEPAALGPLVGKVLGVKPVSITYQAKGKERSMRIPNIAEMEIAAIEGQGGKLVTIENEPLTAVPNQTTTVARSKKLIYHDHGMNWDITGKNGYYSPFSFKGP